MKMYLKKKKTKTAPSPPMSMLPSSLLSMSSSSILSSPMFVFFLFLFSFIAFTSVSADDNTYNIINAPDFIDFAKKVNNGTTFSGTTVFLSGDIDFSSYSDDFEPVGKTYSSKYFTGTFDGQGHTITDLVVNLSDFGYTGLFGYSSGLTIKNLIIDSSCSFTSYFNLSSYVDVFVSSVIGHCGTSGSTCTIESVVNMADVSYLHGSRKYVIAGGVAGKCEGNCSLSNIVNFEPVLTASDISSNSIYSGGIVGEIEGKSGFVSIRKCINYGTVANTIKGNNYMFIGGIVGIIWSNVAIENCLVAGSVSSVESSNSYTGSIIGGIKALSSSSSSPPSNNTISNCFWTESVGSLNASGQIINDISALVITNSSTIEMSESDLAMIRDTMNAGTSSECGWVTVHLNGGRFGNSTQEDLLILQKSLITDPVKEGHSFVTWCNDTECTKSCNSSSVSECTSAEFYASWNVSTLTIDFDNGTAIDVEVEFNSTITITKPTREGHKFIGWNDTIPTNMPAHNIAIKAIWAINNYTLSIDFDNGTVVDVREVEFNSTINIPNVSEREGHKFIGWNDTIPTNMPAHNFAIKAIWVNVTSPSDSVEIVFGTKDLSNDEINEIIKKYAGGGGYKITNITHTNDEIAVIVKFNGVEDAIAFLNNVSASSEKEVNFITKIDFLQEAFSDTSLPFNPLPFLFIIL